MPSSKYFTSTDSEKSSIDRTNVIIQPKTNSAQSVKAPLKDYTKPFLAKKAEKANANANGSLAGSSNTNLITSNSNQSMESSSSGNKSTKENAKKTPQIQKQDSSTAHYSQNSLTKLSKLAPKEKSVNITAPSHLKATSVDQVQIPKLGLKPKELKNVAPEIPLNTSGFQSARSSNNNKIIMVPNLTKKVSESTAKESQSSLRKPVFGAPKKSVQVQDKNTLSLTVDGGSGSSREKAKMKNSKLIDYAQRIKSIETTQDFTESQNNAKLENSITKPKVQLRPMGLTTGNSYIISIK